MTVERIVQSPVSSPIGANASAQKKNRRPHEAARRFEW